MFRSIQARVEWPRPLRAAVASATATGLVLASMLAPSVPTALASSFAIVPGGMTLTTTFNSIGIEVRFTGDDNANANAALQFKKSSDSTWRAGLPLWRTDDGSTNPGRAFFGSALLLDAGASYDVRVTLSDPDGVSGAPLLTGSTTTRAENIPVRSVLRPTYYVMATGNDAYAGTTGWSAWRTLDKAMKSAPAGAVVQFGPGYFKASSTSRTTPITLVTQYPAVDDANTPINPGHHTVIDSGVDSGPIASSGLVTKPWLQVSLPDPSNPTRSYSVWKWAASGLTNASQLGYATTRTAEPKRLALWSKDSLDLATAAGWATKLYTNQTYNYGFYADGADVYLRLPGDANPNTLYVTLGNSIGLNFDAPNISVYGFEVRQFAYGVLFGPHASFGVVDHNQFVGNLNGVAFEALAGTPPTYGGDHVVQYNRIADSSLWTANHTTDPGIPWTFIKAQIVNADGSIYPTRRIGGWSESTAVFSKDGGAHRVVIRNNTLDDHFNGVSMYPAGWTDRYANQDTDVYANLIHHIPDDSLEPTGQIINFRAWGNRIEDASDVLSADPVNYGPIFLFRNVGWRLGSAGVPYNAQGKPTYGGSSTGSSVFFKYDDGSTVQPRLYVLHNTLWADPSLSASIALGGADYGGSSSGFLDALYLRNNIIHTTNYVFAVDSASMWDENYNNFSTSDASRGLKYVGFDYPNVADYRAASGQGGQTNLSNDFMIAPVLNNPLAGDLSLPAISPLVDAGIPIPNLSDRAGIDYNGAAPDLGAIEH